MDRSAAAVYDFNLSQRMPRGQRCSLLLNLAGRYGRRSDTRAVCSRRGTVFWAEELPPRAALFALQLRNQTFQCAPGLGKQSFASFV